MKEFYDKKLGCYVTVPETILEAINELENFFIADFGQKDWSINSIKKHFMICMNQIKEIEKNKKCIMK
jgi:archaellum component FlaC